MPDAPRDTPPNAPSGPAPDAPAGAVPDAIPQDPQVRARIARQFIEAIPHARALGMRLDAIGGGRAVISMPYDARLVGDPRTGVIHGGAVSALMDTCGGAAVMSHAEAPAGTATIDLRIDYMRPAIPGQRVTAEAVCYHVTRSVAFVRAEARDEEAGRGPVACATGAFTVERGRQASGGRSGDWTPGEPAPEPTPEAPAGEGA